MAIRRAFQPHAYPRSLVDLGLDLDNPAHNRPSFANVHQAKSAIRSYAEERLGQYGVDVRIEAPEEEPLFPPLIETMLFRVAQEAINNIAHHAQASHVDITLKWQPEADLLLCVQDDGCGFDPEEIKNKTDRGFGLMDIRERWAIVGGIVEIESEINKGTRVCVGLEHMPNCHDCPNAQWKAGKLVCQCPERWTNQP